MPGLSPYGGPFTALQANHLLRRTTYGPTRAEVRQATDQGLAATLAALFAATPLPEPPVYYDYEDDPLVPNFSTWVDTALPAGQNMAKGARKRSLFSWHLQQFHEQGTHIREKLTLFWMNHFGTNEDNTNDPRMHYHFGQLLRDLAAGDARELVKRVTVSPLMLRFLNGHTNNKNNPNENYARELMELYTLGKGALAGPGDYTTFTEDDVLALARALTGWRVRGFNTTNPNTPLESFFQANRHDTTDKQLSHRFDDAVISDGGAEEYAQVVDLLFDRPETATHLARELYRWFVYYRVDESVEAEVIAPLAQLLLDNDYQIEPVLRTLLASEHFFDALSIGPMIRNPLDYLFAATRGLDYPFPAADPFVYYRQFYVLFNQASNMEQRLYNCPTVAGWSAYHQDPVYYRSWISAVTLPVRMRLVERLSGNGFNVNGQRVIIEVLDYVATLDHPSDPNALIGELSAHLHPVPLTAAQHDYLKEILIPGLPDFEWTVEYEDYLADPSNEDLRTAVRNKLRELFRAMLVLPEFILS